MRPSAKQKGIVDVQTVILLELSEIKEKNGSSGSMGLLAIAESTAVDRATIRRNLEGDKRFPLENSLLGKWLVARVQNGNKLEYKITEDGEKELGIKILLFSTEHSAIRVPEEKR